MRAAPLLLLAGLAGCVVEGHRPAPPPAPPPVVAPAARGISRDEAVDIAFRVARERGLRVDRVDHAHRDGAGRWHVDLRGGGDRAKILLDARDGRLLRGRFRASEEGGRWRDDG